MSDNVSTISVIGAGTMGHGIAQVAAVAGYRVKIHDADGAALDAATGKIDGNLQGGVDRGKLTPEEKAGALGRLSVEKDLAAAVGDASLVIEAIVEKIDVKRKVFAAVEGHAPEDAVLATNTSSLPIAQIAAGVKDGGRVIGMHFFNPVHIMKLVEVVVHAATSDRARAAVLEVARRMGKEPIVVRDSPGFASSRLGVVLGLEAMRMVEQEVASPGDIDKAMELGYKHPMGPLRLTDLVGLDVRLAIAEVLHRELGGAQYEPPEILRDKVARGELGKKSGQGFYSWDS